ncbi:MAG: dihydroorotate dehydrogenase electron transfer subunit [Eubacteriales bacterium]|nr:dihydroorotate dehydrogenase electron transfer subunit [Eubacteriales bacterium]
MSTKKKETCTIVSQEQIAGGIYSMWLQTQTIAKEAAPGQFLSVYTRDAGKILPRPISICEIDRERGRIRLVYRVTGKNTGTEQFSKLHPGIGLEVLGPLGNGFPLKEAEGKRVFLMGGGIGIPPMLQTAKELKADKKIIVGYRDELFLTEELSENGELFAATEDGSFGTHGNVMDAVRENALEADVIMACGPAPMLRAIKAYALEKQIPCWISMEERMACGIGACLGCVCKSTEIDEHSHVHNKRVCKDGPVFLSTEVEL